MPDVPREGRGVKNWFEQIDAHPVLCLLAFLADVVILTVLLWELA